METQSHLVLYAALAALIVFVAGHAVQGRAADTPRRYVPVLNEEPSSKRYELMSLGSSATADITYSPSGQFFIVEDRRCTVVDADGQVRFSVETNSDVERLPLSPYVVSAQGVYDLSQPEPVFRPFVRKVNDEPGMTLVRKTFDRMLQQAYQDADVVIYGRMFWNQNMVPGYFRIDGDWVLFNLPFDYVAFDVDHELGTTVERFPPKHERMIHLADARRGVLAAPLARIRHSEIPLPEDRMAYHPAGELDTLSFETETVFDRSYFLNIPLSHIGTAVYELTVDGEAMVFREYAVKPVIGARESQLYWYVLPDQYRDESDVSFLEFNPYANASGIGGHDVYVLRRISVAGASGADHPGANAE